MSENKWSLNNILFTILRVTIGWVFLFSFLDKNFGWFEYKFEGKPYGTPKDAAWEFGTSDNDPTWGFLNFGTQGKYFGEFIQDNIAGEQVTIWLFMLGLLGVGVAMILGIMRKIAAISGATMMSFMWLASLPLPTNPILDSHVIYAVVVLILGFTDNHGVIFVSKWKEISESKPFLA